MSFEIPMLTFDGYAADFAERGGIVEERIVGDEVRSPSVQMRVTPLGVARGAVDARPGARRAERPVLSRLPLPGRSGLLDGDHARGGEGRRASRERGCARPVRRRLRRRQVGRQLGSLRDRAQPAQGRHDASVPHASVPDRRGLRPRDGRVHGAERPREALRRIGSRREPELPLAYAGRPLRHRRCATVSTSTSRDRPASSST